MTTQEKKKRKNHKAQKSIAQCQMMKLKNKISLIKKNP
jgi:hypothetical protein